MCLISINISVEFSLSIPILKLIEQNLNFTKRQCQRIVLYQLRTVRRIVGCCENALWRRQLENTKVIGQFSRISKIQDLQRVYNKHDLKRFSAISYLYELPTFLSFFFFIITVKNEGVISLKMLNR